MRNLLSHYKGKPSSDAAEVFSPGRHCHGMQCAYVVNSQPTLQLWKEGHSLNHTRRVGWHAHILMHAYLHED